MNLHIMTLNWNGKHHLEKLAPTLDKAMCRLNQEGVTCYWHVRDNGSKDDSVQYLKSVGFLDSEFLSHTPNQLRIYEVGHNNASFAAGMNFLFDQTEAKDDDYLLFLNNDIVFGDDWGIYNMFDCYNKHKDAGMVGARLLYQGTTKLQHAGVIFSDRYNKLPYHFRHGEETDKEAQRDREFQAVTAACALVKAKDWRTVDGMSEEFWWCFEDIDFCFKISKDLGKKILYCGRTNIYHSESASLKKNPLNKMFMPQNVNRFKEKWLNKYEIDHDNYLNNKNYKAL